MTSIQPIDLPGSLPQDWQALVDMIATMLPAEVDVSSLVITSNGELVNYLTGEKWIPITTMREVIVGWAKVEGANPAESTDIAIRPITDLVPVAGGNAVKDVVSGKGAFGLVKNTVILGSLMALFISTLTPLSSQADYEQALLDVLEDYTIDGENILVYIDENGKSHVSETVMNAVRNALINLGTYNTGAEEITIPQGVTPRFLWDTPIPLYTYSDGAVISGNIKNDGASSSYNFFRFTFHDITHTEPIYYGIILHQRTENNWTPAPFLISRATFSGKVDWYRIRNDGYIGESLDRNISGTRESFSGNVFYQYTSGASFGSDFTSKQDAVSFLNANVSPAISDSIVSSMYNVLADYFYLIDNGIISGGESVPGVDVTGKSDFGDLSKTLEDAITGLANRYITIANPQDGDIFNKDKWYELNLNSNDVWTDGLTSDQTNPVTNTQGESDDNTKDEIIEKLLEIIQDLTGDPDLPDVPVGDSGNTPPAEPPVLNGSSNGLWAIYNPTKQEVHDFGAWLWSSNIIDQIVRQFNSPIDAIIGFHQIYCTPTTGSPKVIKAGFLDSPVSAKEVTDQYATINCGQVSVNEYYHTALDYNNSKLAIYLPFVGIVSLDVAVCTGSTLEVIYRIDVFTGTCLAQVKVIKDNSNAVMYTFPGNCAVQIPLTATTYTGMVGALINGAGAVGSFLSGNLMGAVRHGANALASGLTNLTGTQQSGSLGSNAGALGIRKPYLIITHPVAYDATAYNTQYGYPLNKTVSLGSLSGYTEVKDIHLSGIPCTDDELELIEKLLKDGVIIN